MFDAQSFLILFLALFALQFAIERILSFVNARHVLANRGTVPESLRGLVSAETYARSVDYTLVKARFGFVAAVYDAVVVLCILFWLLPRLNGWLVLVIQDDPLTRGVVFMGAVIFYRTLFQLPISFYSTFWIEARFGFNKTTPRMFVIDRLKGFALLAIVGIPFAYALLAFVTYSGALWWLWASLFVIGFQFLMMILFPLVIAPLFNKFTPLGDGELKERLTALARDCGFAAKGIFVMDGSKRSSHSNAYFTGFGKARRIVLFDTLIQQLDASELSAVLAHEIGHYKRRHIPKMMAIAIASTLAGFYVLSLLIAWPPMYAAFGFDAPSAAVGLLLFTFIVEPFTFWVEPITNALSRRHEYEADAYAAEHTDPAPMESALLKLHEKNLSNLTPHPAYSAYHYSHPALLERIGALRAHPASARGPAAAT